jgi:hypothetical protein
LRRCREGLTSGTDRYPFPHHSGALRDRIREFHSPQRQFLGPRSGIPETRGGVTTGRPTDSAERGIQPP